MGFRSSATELNDKTYPMSGYSGTMTEQYTRNKYLKAYYDAILSDMARHYTRPSFTAYTPGAAKTFELEYKTANTRSPSPTATICSVITMCRSAAVSVHPSAATR